MPISSDLYVAQLLMKLANRETGEISKVDYRPQKPAFPAQNIIREQSLPRTSPEQQGVQSGWLRSLFDTLGSSNASHMHKIMVLRHGVVVGETAYAPYEMDQWHVTHSMCKSITGMAIGILVSEGKLNLNDKVIDIMSDKKTLTSMIRLRDLTIEHLLTMQSGVSFNETGAISGNDWIKGYMDSGTDFAPGTRFAYNSMNSYMLSAIVSKITGMSLFDFVNARIFGPMGITRVCWESDPNRITKGGWGLFMRIEDMCKLGQMYLQKGMWKGKQIVPANWVESSIAGHVATEVEGATEYGYHIWVDDVREGTFEFNGMLGQNVYVFPDIDMVIGINAGSTEIFQTGEMTEIIYDHIRKIQVFDELPENEIELTKLKMTCKRLQGRNLTTPVIKYGGWSKTVARRSKKAGKDFDIDHQIQKIIGKTYDVGKSGVGIFPLLMQIFHNNFTDGITKIGFVSLSHHIFGVQFYEGNQIYTIPCGSNFKHNKADINMHGEIYHTVNRARLSVDEWGRIVIMMRLVFLEEATERHIYLYVGRKNKLEDEGMSLPPENYENLTVQFSEMPGTDILMSSLSNVTPSTGIEGFFMQTIEKTVAKVALNQTMSATIRPRIYGTLIKNN